MSYLFHLVSAESYYNDALVIYQKVHGPVHEKTVSVQDDIARLQIRTDKQQVPFVTSAFRRGYVIVGVNSPLTHLFVCL